MNDQIQYKDHYLFPGNIFASIEPHIVTTVLGSCVAVCLYDKTRSVGGINHFMLPLWNGEGLASPKYGNIAIVKLIDSMLDLGCDKRNLIAKVFGGGEVLRVSKGILNVGERNIVLAKDLLSEQRIPIISSDLGGTTGRKLLFYTNSGSVMLKKLNKQIDDVKI